MNLTAELFRQIVTSGQWIESRPATIDRRRVPRARLDVQAELMPFSDRFAAENLTVPIRDLSRGGFAFFHDQRLPLGEQFALVLPESTGSSLVLQSTVTYWQPLDTNFFAIGARFCRILRRSDGNLPLLLQDAESGRLTDLRIAS